MDEEMTSAGINRAEYHKEQRDHKAERQEWEALFQYLLDCGLTSKHVRHLVVQEIQGNFNRSKTNPW